MHEWNQLQPSFLYLVVNIFRPFIEGPADCTYDVYTVCNSVTSNLHCSWHVCAPGSDFHQRLVVATANADGRFNAWNDAFIKLNICCLLLCGNFTKTAYKIARYCICKRCTVVEPRHVIFSTEKIQKKNTAPIRVDMHVYTNTWTLFNHQQKVQKMQKFQEQMTLSNGSEGITGITRRIHIDTWFVFE